MLLFYFFILCFTCTTITPTQAPLQPILLALDCDNEENIFLPESNFHDSGATIIFEILQALSSKQRPCIITNHHMLEGIISLGNLMHGILNQDWDDNDFLHNTNNIPHYHLITYYDHLVTLSIHIKEYLTCTTAKKRVSFVKDLKTLKANTDSIFCSKHPDYASVMVCLASYLMLKKLQNMHIYKDEDCYYVTPYATQAAILAEHDCINTPFNRFSTQKQVQTQAPLLEKLPVIINHLLKNQNINERIIFIVGHGAYDLRLCASLNHKNIKKIIHAIPEKSVVILDTCENGGYNSAQLFNAIYPFHLFIRGGIDIMSTFGKSFSLINLFTRSHKTPSIQFYDASWDTFREQYLQCAHKDKAIYSCINTLVPYGQSDEVKNHILSVKKAQCNAFEVVTNKHMDLITHTNTTCYTIAKNSLIRCLVIEPIDFPQDILIETTTMPSIMAFEMQHKIVFRSIKTITAPEITLQDIVESFFKLDSIYHTRGFSLKNVSCSTGKYADVLCIIKALVKNQSCNIFMYKNAQTNKYYGERWAYQKETIIKLPQNNLPELEEDTFNKKYNALIHKFHKATTPPVKQAAQPLLSSDKKRKMQ